MRSRHSAAAAFIAVLSLSATGGAQSGDPNAGGLIAGDYIRVSAGVTTPVSPQGSLRSWGTGTGIGLGWENWQFGGSGVGRLGFGINAAYSFLPFKDDVFVNESAGLARSATAKQAGILEINS